MPDKPKRKKFTERVKLDGSEKKSQRVRLYDNELPYPKPKPQLSTDETWHIEDLSRNEERFCWRYTMHYNKVLAAIECGYSPTRAHIKAEELLRNPLVQNRIASVEADRLRKMQFDGDLHFAIDLLTSQASPSELVELIIPPCRYCHGVNHEYQRTHEEYSRSLDKWNRLPDQLKRPALRYDEFGRSYYDANGRKLPFDEMGGDGFDPEQRPNPACPNCKGRGAFNPHSGTLPYQKLKDSRDLTLAGKILYGGMKVNKGTVEILMRDQEAARNRVAKMVERFLELKAGQTEDGKPYTTFDLKPQITAVGDRRITKVERIIIDPPKRTNDDEGDEFEDVA